jgi:beta-hydroxylase
MLAKPLDFISERNKEAFKNRVNDVFVRAELDGRFPRLPPFSHDYADEYPGLRALEAGYADVRRECLELLQMKDRLTDVEALGGAYTQGGIHAIAWKTFMFKAGGFLPENCKRAPRTAELLRGIDGLFTAFFSVLEPHQYIKPHWGYWKGFVRYHLGVVIPEDNRDGKCWLRINTDPDDNRKRDKSAVERGEKYLWHDGEGVLFDDTFLHDAANDSDQVRVVLWLDIKRKMPLPLSALNSAFVGLAQFEPSIYKVRKKAIVR